MLRQEIIRRRILRRPGFWFFQITGWGLFYFVSFFQSFFSLNSFEKALVWTVSMLIGFITTILLRIIYSKIYAKGSNILKTILVILVGSFLGAMFWTIVNGVFQIFAGGWIIEKNVEIRTTDSLYWVINRGTFLAFPLLVWSTLYFGIKFWYDLFLEKERSEQALLLANTAQLKMLRYQLNPHFLFNSLSSIQALIYDDQKLADKILTELSDFLRYTIRDTDKFFVSLEREIDIIRKYLNMEKQRFPERLDYEIDVDERVRNVPVITFLLQPFVENAIKYGMTDPGKVLHISVSCYQHENYLHVAIQNNGSWIERTGRKGSGIENVRTRLNNAYQGKEGMSISTQDNQVIVHIEIPIEK